MRPKKDLTSVAVTGGVACFMAATLVGLALIPFSEKVYPKKFNGVLIKHTLLWI